LAQKGFLAIHDEHAARPERGRQAVCDDDQHTASGGEGSLGLCLGDRVQM
jgi:hypothetical protein